MRAERSMNARAIPNSSLVATPGPSAWRFRNSPRRRLERSATSANTFALWAGSGEDCVAGMSLALSVANHAICADRTLQAPIAVEKVQMSHRLAHGEEQLMRIELAAKQGIEDVHRSLRRLAGFMELGEAQAVVLLQLRDALAQTPEGQPMRGQRERRRGKLCVAAQGSDERRERISLRLVRPHADVGRDPGDPHAAGDEDSELLEVERCVLGGMAVTHDDSPIAAADAMRLPVHQAPVAGGKTGHPTAIVGAALLHELEPFPGESVAHEHGHHVVEAETRASFAHRVRGEILRLRHPELGAGALGEPRRQTGMVGVMVGDYEAPDRTPRDACGEDTLPQRARDVVADAAVDEGPAFAVFEEPEIDVVERKGQRHAQPVRAGRDLQRVAGRRLRAVRILQDGFGAHALWMARGGRSRIRSFPRRKLRILADYGAARHKTIRPRRAFRR